MAINLQALRHAQVTYEQIPPHVWKALHNGTYTVPTLTTAQELERVGWDIEDVSRMIARHRDEVKTYTRQARDAVTVETKRHANTLRRLHQKQVSELADDLCELEARRDTLLSKEEAA